MELIITLLKINSNLVIDMNNIELRSDKTRRILGDIPRSLVWTGIIVIAIITAALITALFLLPYPYGEGESIIAHILN